MEQELFSNRDLRRLIVPLIFEQMLGVTVGMADTMMVSSLGEARISGVALVDMINTFVFGVFGALATGGAVVVSQYIGARKERLARESAWQLIGVNFVLGAAFLAYAEVFTRWTIHALFGDVADDVMVASMTYFRLTALSFPFVSTNSACAALLRSQNRAVLSLYSAMMSNVVNVLGNALLIYVWQWGVAGAATATVIARGMSMMMLLICLFNRNNAIYLSFRDKIRPDVRIIRKILHIAIPSGIENGIFQFGRLFVVAVIAVFGTSQITANAVANSIDYLGCMVGSAISLAVITVVGQAVGRGDEQQVRFYVRKMMKIGCISHFLWGLVVFAVTPLCLSCYTLTDETRRLAVILILIHNGLGLVMWPWSFIFPNVLRSINDVRFTMLLSILSMVFVRVGGSYLLGGINYLGWGVVGVWWAMVLDWIVRISGFLWRYHSGAWVKYMRER